MLSRELADSVRDYLVLNDAYHTLQKKSTVMLSMLTEARMRNSDPEDEAEIKADIFSEITDRLQGEFQ